MRKRSRVLTFVIAATAFAVGGIGVSLLVRGGEDPAPATPGTATAAASPTTAPGACPVDQPVCDFAARVEREFREGDPRTLVSPKSQHAAEPGGITTAAGALLRGGATAPRVIAIGCPLRASRPACGEAFSLTLTGLAEGHELDPNGRALLGFQRDGTNLPIITVLYMVGGFDALTKGGDVARCDLSGLPSPADCQGTRFYPYRTGPAVVLAPTPTPLAQPSADPLAGVERVALTTGMQATLGYGSIVYYSTGCFGCGRPQIPNLFRAYRDGSGQLRTDDLMAPLLARVPGAYVNSVAADWARGHLLAQVCKGYCGGEGEAQPGSTVRMFRSRDGGVTWTEEDAKGMPVESFLRGFASGEALVFASERKGTEYFERFLLWPSGKELTPPAGAGKATPFPDHDGAIAWRNYEPGGGYYDANGKQLIPGVPNRRLYSVTPLATGWFAMYEGATPDASTAAVYDGAGKPIRVLTLGNRYLDVRGQLPSGQLIANVELAETFGFGVDAGSAVCKQQQHVYAALINWSTTASIHPIIEFGECPPNRGHIFLNAIVAREPVRVVAPGDCLNVRREAATASGTLGCFADGVLLTRRVEGVTPVTGWVAVLTPGGEPGWASEQFVSR